MENKSPRSVKDFFTNKQNELNKLTKRARSLKSLEQKILKVLDPAVSKSVEIANFENDTLVLKVDNANIATHLRYLAPNIIASLKSIEDLKTLKNLKTILDPTCFTIQEPKTPKRQITKPDDNAIALIESLANDSNDALSASLKKLSQTLKSRK